MIDDGIDAEHLIWLNELYCCWKVEKKAATSINDDADFDIVTFFIQVSSCAAEEFSWYASDYLYVHCSHKVKTKYLTSCK